MGVEKIVQYSQNVIIITGFMIALLAISNLLPDNIINQLPEKIKPILGEKTTKATIWFVFAFTILALSLMVNNHYSIKATDKKIESLEIKFKATVLKTSQARLRELNELKSLRKKSIWSENKKLIDDELHEVGAFWARAINPDYSKERKPQDAEAQKMWFTTSKVNFYKGLKTNTRYSNFENIAQNIEYFNNTFGTNYTLLDLDKIIKDLESKLIK